MTHSAIPADLKRLSFRTIFRIHEKDWRNLLAGGIEKHKVKRIYF